MSNADLVDEWFQYARNDLISTKHLFEDLFPRQNQIVCYLSQQCAEKSLKGYIFYINIEPPKSHNLIELCQICINQKKSFLEIIDACVDLTPYGVAVRYPNELAVDEIMAKSAINKSQFIYDFCFEKIP